MGENTVSHFNIRTRYTDSGLGILFCCVAIAFAVAGAHILGNTILIYACIFFYLVFHCFACVYGYELESLLFFLPWSPLLKLYIGSSSFFTFAIILTCIVMFIKNKCKFNITQLVLAAVVFALTMIAKAIQGNSLSNSYLFLLIILVLFPSITKGIGRNANFWRITIFFSIGIITAALSAQKFLMYGNISQFITVNTIRTMTRLSGYYSDPNFYAAQICACIAGVLLLLIKEKKLIRQIVLAILGVILIYCGLLSGSKTFAVVSVCLLVVWIPILFSKVNLNNKIKFVIGFICIVAIIFSSVKFQELFQMLIKRFSNANTLSNFTTHRTELWKMYLIEFTHNAPLTLFGQGYTAVTLNTKASHNTIIQSIFQFGLIGTPFFYSWMYTVLKDIYIGFDRIKIKFSFVLIMLIGVVLPWMALDILFFDEIFILPVFAFIGIMYMSSEKTDKNIGEIADAV